MLHQLNQQELATHVKALGWLVFVSGLLGVMGTVCSFTAMVTVAVMADEPEAARILPILATGIAGYLGLLSCISLAAGYGLIKRRPWARVLGLVDAFLGLPLFPVGTIFGLYELWVLLQAEAEPFFNPPTGEATVAG